MKHLISNAKAEIEDSIESAIERVLPTVTAPVYVVPNSIEANDYTVHIDLDVVRKKLDAGMLSRPAITLYAGRSDLNKDILAENVESVFMEAMAAYEERVIEITKKGSTSKQNETGELMGKLKNVSLDGVILSIIATIVSGPIGFGFLLLSYSSLLDAIKTAMKLPGSIAASALEKISSPFTSQATKLDIQRDRCRIKSALSSQELHMHRKLIALAGSWDNKVQPFRGQRHSFELPDSISELVDRSAGPYFSQYSE